jgi:hypothetical protein
MTAQEPGTKTDNLFESLFGFNPHTVDMVAVREFFRTRGLALEFRISEEERKALFTDAWRQGVQKVGRCYFHGDPETATNYKDMAPKWDAFREAMSYASSGEVALMRAMYSLYCRYDARDLLDRPMSLLDMTVDLDPDCRKIVTDLLLLHPGW